MDLIDNIKNNRQVKESLIELKLLSDTIMFKSDDDLKTCLIRLIEDADPKVRKNSALLLGNYDNTIEVLLDRYHKEDIDYVKEAYLKGISIQNCQDYVQQLIAIQEELMKLDADAKHIQAQLKILNPLILQCAPHKKKVVKLKHEPVDVILTSLPYYQFVIFEHVLHLKYKPVTQGVLVRTESLYELLNIRVYKDMLIPLSNASAMNIDEEEIVNGIKQSNLLDIINRLYDDQSPFYFRVVDAMRVKDPHLIRKVSEKLFELYPQKLLNTTENYDIEIVLKEVRQDKVNAYLRLTHFKSLRFDYRKEVSATSMQPYVAATLAQLAKPYMKEDAKVLDPFVGTGTLMIERNVVKPTSFAMGIDVFAKTIESARKNTKAANQTVYFVNKDALRFVNAEMFDEIITDMPTINQMKDSQQLRDIYDRFFDRIHRLVKPEGYIFLYTSEISLVRKNLRIQDDYLNLVEHYEVPRGKNMFYFFIMQVK